MKWRPTIRFSSAPRIAVALAVALALAAGCAKKEPAATSRSAPAGSGAEGTQAAAFELPDLDGKVVRLADFSGKVVILDFWATWCPPCRAEVPHLVELQDKYRDQGLAIVGLSLDAGGAGDVRPFSKEHSINYTMLIANDGTQESYGGITGIPTAFVLDRKGRIVKRFLGYTAPEVLEETIRPLLAPAS
jgi:thiol-disulfide isomerase/thioredoxin